QPDRERRPGSGAFARGADAPAVQLGEIADNRQAKTKAAVLARKPAVGLSETLEQMRHELRVDALAIVFHDDVDETPIGAALEREPDMSAARGELDGVRQQVPHDLLKPVRVAGDRGKTGRDRNLERHAF